MNIVDTSGWLEYFSDGLNADKFLAPLQDSSSLIVPVITIYEVFKIVLRESSENEALQAIAAMEKGQVIELTTSIAMTASKLSINYSLPMADSLILSTALYGLRIQILRIYRMLNFFLRSPTNKSS
jgi:predicted nucleic acid-binding protein